MGFFINVSYEIFNVSDEISFSKYLVYIELNLT